MYTTESIFITMSENGVYTAKYDTEIFRVYNRWGISKVVAYLKMDAINGNDIDMTFLAQYPQRFQDVFRDTCSWSFNVTQMFERHYESALPT